MSYAQLYDLVSDLVSALLAQGLKAGDRVASYSSNGIVSGTAPFFAFPFDTFLRMGLAIVLFFPAAP